MADGALVLIGVPQMLQARLVVTQVMDLWQVSGALLTDEGGEWHQLATWADSLPLEHDPDVEHDDLLALLRAVRLWSEMTIQR